MYLKEFFVQIRGESQDIVQGLQLSETIYSLQHLRNDVESYSSHIYKHYSVRSQISVLQNLTLVTPTTPS